MKRLAQTLEALDRNVELFFRNDDAGWAQQRLSRLILLFSERELPLDLAVIPAALDPSTARELRAIRAIYPGLGLHQHGYAHVNHEPRDRRKCEFGLARPPARQLADVIAGRERLSALLGDWDPIFTPPWNRCSSGLGDALAEHGFSLLSTDSRRSDTAGIGQLPVCLDWERARGADLLEDSLCAALAANAGPVGIMLHHAVMDEDARCELAAALDLLSACPQIEALPMRRWIGDR